MVIFHSLVTWTHKPVCYLLPATEPSSAILLKRLRTFTFCQFLFPSFSSFFPSPIAMSLLFFFLCFFPIASLDNYSIWKGTAKRNIYSASISSICLLLDFVPKLPYHSVVLLSLLRGRCLRQTVPSKATMRDETILTSCFKLKIGTFFTKWKKHREKNENRFSSRWSMVSQSREVFF